MKNIEKNELRHNLEGHSYGDCNQDVNRLLKAGPVQWDSSRGHRLTQRPFRVPSFPHAVWFLCFDLKYLPKYQR